MKTFRIAISFSLVLSALLAAAPGAEPEPPFRDLRSKAQNQFRQSNFKDAYRTYRSFIFNPRLEPRQAGADFKQAIDCLRRLGRLNETDAVREEMVAAHPENWMVLQAVAENWLSAPPNGFIIAGEFERGQHRGGGEYANCEDRDRVRALRLMLRALPLVKESALPSEASGFYFNFADMLLRNRGYGEAWRLQYLTELDELPDVEKGGRWGLWRGGRSTRQLGAPVDIDGDPICYVVPDSFETAASDGERWRWLLEQAAEVNPNAWKQSLKRLADFGLDQFGVQTLADYGWFFNRPRQPSDGDESGTYQLHTLGEDETIARLATGIKRFALPEDYDYIQLYRRLDDYDQLARIFENRRQYPRAAECWRTAIQENGRNEQRQNALDQIVRNWGQFEPVESQPADEAATVDFKFRNGSRLALSAYAIDVEQLLDDVKEYIKNNANNLDWRKIDIGNIGYRLVNRNETRYRGNKVAEWDIDLDPAPDHFDRRITIETPLKKAGAYLLEAQMVDGNRSSIVLWINDTAIVKRALDGAEGKPNRDWYFVADAVDGSPVAGANVEFFGYMSRYENDGRGRSRRWIDTVEFAELSDENGQVVPDPQDYLDPDRRDGQYIVTARTDEGRFAFLGFTRAWYGRRYDAEYNQIKTFFMTDRPVYRPGQEVKFKVWIRRAQYDLPDESSFAGKQFSLSVRDARNEEILKQTLTADGYGGLSGSLKLDDEAALGMYRINIDNYGSSSFRVEEYKKPEFEVGIEAPTEPVMLGEKITATVRADYYFGEPVREAKVKLKVTRSPHSADWFPPRPWDWLYGPGYWWFARDYEWYPGWGSWGVACPMPVWWSAPTPEPEVVLEREVEIGPDGTVPVEIDTALAQAMHGDQDHRYSISAEVTDQSRRTIVGKGSVLVARQPYKVYAWVDRGYYRVGETVRASFSARTLDRQPVQGDGVLRLLRISYDSERQPIETVVQRWDLDTDPQGRSDLKIQASRAGQYRLSYELSDRSGHKIEGGYLFVVRGEGDDGRDYRFNAIELVPDQAEYAPGETVRLMLRTEQTGSTVALFLRPANGVYLPPRIMRIKGKMVEVPIEISRKDMPNFFIEAFTVSGGEVHRATREIVVPPEQRILNAELLASKSEYKPGEKASIELRLTDLEGRPFVGSAVMTVYDRAVEYISGGSNVADIKSFFWKWRRQHNPRGENSLERREWNQIKNGAKPMRPIGVFGHSVADEITFGGAGGNHAMPRSAMLAKSSGAIRGGMAMRADAMVMADAAPAAEMAAFSSAGEEQGGKAAEEAPTTVRTQFADTAYWNAELLTDSNGVATVEFDMPENLTGWKVRLWAMGQGTRVGEATAEIATKKNLMLRMQAPRFFVQKDEVVLSANIHNYLEGDKRVRAVLELEGGCLEALDDCERIVVVESGGELRVDWRVRAVEAGTAAIVMKALSDEESDAMRMEFPVYVHGMLRTESFSGAIRPEQESASFSFTVPEERRPEQSRLEIRWSPSLAGAMVDALPYLADYPYGCTEQTLSRFLPAVLTRKVLRDIGLDLESIAAKQTNLNAQEIGDDRERAKQWKRYERNPVFDQHELDRMVKEGLKRIYDMQIGDGGWGWFSGRGARSSAHTTAYVVHSLQLARSSGLAVVDSAIDRGLEWLERYQREQVRMIKDDDHWKDHPDNLDAFVFMVLADGERPNSEMRELLYTDRQQLAVYAKAMLGLAMDKLGRLPERDMLISNIDQYLVQDDENQSAWLELKNGNYWWYWYGSEYEAQAYFLKLLCRSDPKGEKAARLVKYLVNNRKHATYWNSTRDTAICVEAMAEYMRSSGELKPDMTVEVLVDGVLRKEIRIAPESIFSFDNKLILEGDQLSSGAHAVEIRKRGVGPLYFNAYQSNFTLEDDIPKAGLEVKVARRFYRLVEDDKQVKARGDRGQAVDQRVDRYKRIEIGNLERIKSGELVEVELIMESKNDYEYIVIEDRKPAGFEPIEVRSGYSDKGLHCYVEYRDEKVVFFADRLARGRHSVAYRVRAEIPGKFSALPSRIEAMYAPELKGNSNEFKLRVAD